MSEKLCVVLGRNPSTVEETEFIDKLFTHYFDQNTEYLFLDKDSPPHIKQTLKNSKAIIPMGQAALYFVLGIKKIKSNRGKHLYSDQFESKIFPTYSPFFDEKVDRVTATRFIESDLQGATKYYTSKPYKHNYVTIGPNDREAFDRLIEKLLTLELFSFDIEAHEEENFDVNQTKLLGIGFSWKMGTGVYVVLRDQHKEIPKEEYDYRIEKIKLILTSKAEKIAHNCSYEIQRLTKILGITIVNLKWDTMLMHHLYDENSRHGLDALSDSYAPDLAGYKDESEVFLPKKDASFIYIPTGILARRCCADCDLTLRLHTSLIPPLKEQYLMPLYSQIVIPHRHVLSEGEYTGTRVDLEELNRIDPIIKERADQKLEELRYITGDPDFNPRSPLQVQKKLEQFGLHSSKTTDKGNPATDEDAMNEIMGKSSHPFPKVILEYRGFAKLYSTYVEGIRKRLVGDIIHTNFLVHGTVTGRLSSRNPNLQNIPTDTTMINDYELPTDISIRKLFIPREDHKFIISDGSQMELRILAVASQDPILVDAYLKGEDVHIKTALIIIPGAQELKHQLDKDPDNEELKVRWSWMRKVAKGVNFGIVYGRGAGTLAEELQISLREAQQFLDNYFAEYAGVKKWINETIGFAKRYGYVMNIFGRRRRLLDINSPQSWFRAEAERQAQNSPIQGGAADCVAIANIRIAEQFKKEKINGGFRINIHDELVHEVHNNDVERATEIIKDCWHKPIPRITVPLEAQIEVGTRWQH